MALATSSANFALRSYQSKCFPPRCLNDDCATLQAKFEFFSTDIRNDCSIYMHCDGCEKLLNKDFNICSTCHAQGQYRVFHQMHPFNSKTQSVLNHTGKMKQSRRARCPCKNGKECMYCTYCTGCSCKCHQWFTLHYRFMNLNQELEVLEEVKRIVGDQTIVQSAETKARLFSLISENLPQAQAMVPDDRPVSEEEAGLQRDWSV